jgi:hypothetical protein
MTATLLLIALAAVTSAGGTPPTTAPQLGAVSVRPVSPEEELWAGIVELQAEPLDTAASTLWFDTAEVRRRVLLERLRLYQSLYPGGVHAIAAARLELSTLYELGVLAGGQWRPLCARVAEHLRTFGPEHPNAAEAAYWQRLCRAQRTPETTTQPTTQRMLEGAPELRAAQRQHFATYPHSRHAPRLARVLFEAAARDGDEEEMGAIVAALTQHFPDHAETVTLAGQLRRRQAVGQLFWLAEQQADGVLIDTRASTGVPVLIVVWSAHDDRARQCVLAVEEHRRANPETQVVGVNLDVSKTIMAAACAELGIEWPQFNDGLGRANVFARRWGVERVPHVFVIDRRGRLCGSAHDDTWQELAARALAE